MAKRKSEEYWEKRIAQNVWKVYNSAEEKNRALIDFYQDAAKNIREELYKIAEKYSKNGSLTRTEMYKQQRLEKLEKRFENIIQDLGAQVEAHITEQLGNGISDVSDLIQHELEGPDFAINNKELMNKLLEEPWRGSDSSSRIWENQSKLATELNTQLLMGLQQGKNVTEIAIGLSRSMEVAFSAAHRLVRTETMHYLNSATLERYRDTGMKEVEFWAAEDERTCEICGAMHGKIYSIDKAPVLPLHPNCRCTYLPVADENDVAEVTAEGVELNYNEKAALQKYLSFESYGINDKLRSGERLSADEEEMVKYLDSALRKTPKYEGNLSRSLYFNDPQKVDEFMKDYSVGNTIEFREYLSTTNAQELYNMDGQVHIFIENSHNGRDLSSTNTQEMEVLYERGSRLKILNVVEQDGKYYILAEEA